MKKLKKLWTVQKAWFTLVTLIDVNEHKALNHSVKAETHVKTKANATKLDQAP